MQGDIYGKVFPLFIMQIDHLVTVPSESSHTKEHLFFGTIR